MDAPQTRYARGEDGVSVAFAEFGSGPPILFLGSPFLQGPSGDKTLDFLQRLVGPIAETHRVVYIQPRRTGLSQREGDFSLDARSLDIPAVMDTIGVERAATLGMIQSATPAIRFAATHPSRVSHLILGAPYARGADFYAPGASVQSVVGSVMDYDPGLAAETLARGFGMSPEDIELYREIFPQIVAVEEYQELRAAILLDDVTADLGTLTVPTLVWDYAQDKQARRHAPAVASMIDGASLVIIDDLYGPAPVALAIDRLLAGTTTQAADQPQPSGTFHTILFTDVVASTPLLAQLKDAKMREIMRDHDALLQAAVDAHGGRTVKEMGDGFMVDFPLPSAAVDCAIAMQRAINEQFADTDVPIRLRIGINAGEPIVEDDDLHGASVVIAKRLESAAPANGILIADGVKQLLAGKDFDFHDQGEIELKGFDDPVRAWAVEWSA